MSPKYSLLAAALLSAVTGCAATSQETSGVTENDSAELVSGPGITLTADSDPDLKVNIKVADGVQATTMNKRFLKLTVSRGEASFTSWCKGTGSIGEDGTSQGIDCYDSVSTVSDDDNEGFGITLQKKDGHYEIASVEYGGDGTFYGDRMQILDPSWHWVPHSPAEIEHVALSPKSGEGTQSDPFPMLAKVGTRLAGLLGEEIPNHQTRPLAARSVSFELYNTMELRAKLVLSATGWTTASSENISVLKTPGKLSSGLATASTVKSRVLENLE